MVCGTFPTQVWAAAWRTLRSRTCGDAATKRPSPLHPSPSPAKPVPFSPDMHHLTPPVFIFIFLICIFTVPARPSPTYYTFAINLRTNTVVMNWWELTNKETTIAQFEVWEEVVTTITIKSFQLLQQSIFAIFHCYRTFQASETCWRTVLGCAEVECGWFPIHLPCSWVLFTNVPLMIHEAFHPQNFSDLRTSKNHI